MTSASITPKPPKVHGNNNRPLHSFFLFFVFVFVFLFFFVFSIFDMDQSDTKGNLPSLKVVFRKRAKI